MYRSHIIIIIIIKVLFGILFCHGDVLRLSRGNTWRQLEASKAYSPSQVLGGEKLSWVAVILLTVKALLHACCKCLFAAHAGLVHSRSHFIV